MIYLRRCLLAVMFAFGVTAYLNNFEISNGVHFIIGLALYGVAHIIIKEVK